MSAAGKALGVPVWTSRMVVPGEYTLKRDGVELIQFSAVGLEHLPGLVSNVCRAVAGYYGQDHDDPYQTTSRPSAPAPTGWPWHIPEALSDEDGEYYFWQGHVPPALALLSLVVSEIVNWDAERTLLGSNRERAFVDCPPPSWEQRRQHADELLDAVGHYWAKPDPDDDERMLECAADDPAAQTWTRLYVGP